LKLSEALKVVTDFAVVTKCDRSPILKYFMKTAVIDFILEWLVVMDDEEFLNTGISNLSLRY
jgi:hypothetical protein